MNSTKTIYLVAVNDGKEYETVGDAMFNTNAVCNTVKKAFEIGLWIAGIAEPDHTYRKVADTIREKGIVFISEAGKPETCNIIITKIRKF
jgi:hypothetical protein